MFIAIVNNLMQKYVPPAISEFSETIIIKKLEVVDLKFCMKTIDITLAHKVFEKSVLFHFTQISICENSAKVLGIEQY